MGDNKENRWRGLWWKSTIGVVLFLLIAVSVIAIKFDAIALSFINRSLSAYLVDGGDLKTINCQLLTGSCELGDLSISQPAFAQIPVLKLERFAMQIDLSTLFSDEIVIEKVVVKDLKVSLVRDKTGTLNIEKLLIPTTDNALSADKFVSSDLSLPTIRVQSIEVKNFKIHVIDAVTKKRWMARIRIDFDANDLQLRDMLNGDIFLGEIMVVLSEFSVDQPAGFGSGKLLTVDKITVESGPLDLLSSDYGVKNISVDGFSSSMVVPPDGVSNFHQLVTLLANSKQKSSTKHSEVSATQSSSSFAHDLPHIFVEKMTIEHGNLLLRDESIGTVPVEISLDEIAADAQSINLFSIQSDVNPATLSATFILNQPNGLPVAYFGSFARIGPFNDEIPPLNAQMRLVGFKLDTLGPLFPKSVRAAIGASGFDVGAALSLKSDSIKLQARILTDENIVYDAIRVQGKLSDPKIEVDAILAGFGRVTGGIFNFGKGSLSASYDVAKTGVDITTGVGSSVYHMGKNLGSSLFKTGAGLATFNADQVVEGTVGATGGSFGLMSDAIRSAGSTTSSGLNTSMSSLRGASGVAAWDSEIPERYQAAMTQAQTALSEMAYPLQTD